jgi:hypothetical protein
LPCLLQKIDFLPILVPSIALTLKQSLTLVEAWKSIVYQLQMTDHHTWAIWLNQVLSTDREHCISAVFDNMLLPAQSAFLPNALENVMSAE